MADPRAALAALTAAFERHLEASAQRRGEDDPAVVAAYDDVADAFEEYDETLLEAFGEMTPLEVYAAPDEDDDEDDDLDAGPGAAAGDSDDDVDAEQRYVGLDDEDFEVVENPGRQA